MPEPIQLESGGPTPEQVNAVLSSESSAAIVELLEDLHPAETAHLLESLPPDQGEIVWSHFDPSDVGEIFVETDDAIRLEPLGKLAACEVAALASSVDADDAVDILQDLSPDIVEAVLAELNVQDRERLHKALAYPEDTAGGLMNVDAISVCADVTLEVVSRYLRFFRRNT